jgi:hypothetical protein
MVAIGWAAVLRRLKPLALALGSVMRGRERRHATLDLPHGIVMALWHGAAGHEA